MDKNSMRMLPAHSYPPITPSDATDLSKINGEYPNGISFAAEGTLAVHDINGNTRNFASGELAAGIVHPIRYKRVLSTGTTVTSPRAYYSI